MASEFRIIIRYDLALFFFLGVAVACRNIRVADVPPVFDGWCLGLWSPCCSAC